MAGDDRQLIDPLADPEERAVLYATLDSFRQYRPAAHYNTTHLRRQAFYSLPYKHVDLLSEAPFSFPNTFDAVDAAIDSNAELAEAILAVGLTAFGVGDDSWKGCANAQDVDKARSTIRQFYREWSAEGSSERRACFHPILAALASHLPASVYSDRHQYHVLVPGAGLGRLVFEICKEGYTVEGNEISYHQLMASYLALDCTSGTGQYQIYPFALGFSNHIRRADQLQKIAIPDVHPASALQETLPESQVPFSARMAMSAGDFCEVYRRPEFSDTFDAVTTCFFIDTAPNLINYIKTVQNCLRRGGVWINLGPLLWHFEGTSSPHTKRASRTLGQDQQGGVPGGSTSDGIAEPGSFELSDEEVIALLGQLGFEVIEHTQAPGGETGYNQSPHSMLQDLYRPSFWVAKKKQEDTT